MSDGYTIVDLNELEAFPYHQRDGQKLLPIQRITGLRAVGMNAWIGDAGEPLVPEHAEESENEELYVVVQGRGRFTIDGENFDAPAGTLVYVLPGETRSAQSEEPATIIAAVGATVGQPFYNPSWTSFVVADALRHKGRMDEARATIQDVIDADPDNWGGPYNAACFEALGGNADAAFAHLARAKQLAADDRIMGYLQEDSDLDSIRDDPRFQELLA